MDVLSDVFKQAGISNDHRSLEELAEDQNICPITNLDALGELWPDDDDPDAFSVFILSERKARRELTGNVEH